MTCRLVKEKKTRQSNQPHPPTHLSASYSPVVYGGPQDSGSPLILHRPLHLDGRGRGFRHVEAGRGWRHCGGAEEEEERLMSGCKFCEKIVKKKKKEIKTIYKGQ